MIESSVSLISDCQEYKDTMSKESIDRDMGKADRVNLFDKHFNQ